MPCTITVHPAANLPEDVTAFWRARQFEQDPLKGLTGSPEWFAMMAAGGGGEALVLRKEGGTCCGVIPLLSQTARLGRRVSQVFRVCGGDLIEDGLGAADLRSAMEDLLRRHPRCDAMILDHVQAGSRLELLAAACGRRSVCFLHPVGGEKPHYRLALPPSWESFSQLRSPESIKKIDRRDRALSRETGSPTRLLEIRQMADAAPYAQQIVSLMSTTWQARRLGHSVDLNGMREVASRGWLRCFLLLADAEAVAFVLGYQGMGGYVYEQVGYDQRFARHSPGTILLYRLIRQLYEADTPRWVDFGEGDAEYKQVLANDVISIQSVMAVRRRLDLRLQFAVTSALELGTRVAKVLLAKIGMKQSLARRLKRGSS